MSQQCSATATTEAADTARQAPPQPEGMPVYYHAAAGAAAAADALRLLEVLRVRLLVAAARAGRVSQH